MKNIETEILIIGGGIAGCIAAISLVDKYKVVLIDKLSEPKDRIGESLAPTAQRILHELDLLEGMENTSQKIYIKNMGMQSYWGSEQVQIVDHLRNPDGYVRSLDRKAFEIYLRHIALQRGVDCIWPSKLQNSTYKDGKWSITTKSNDQELQGITTQFVIDATGRQSLFARSIGVQREHIDKLMGCWGIVSNTEGNNMSTIAAQKNGWWYSAVIPNHKRVIAFQTDSDLFEKSTFKNPDTFLKLAKDCAPIAKILEKNTNAFNFQGTVAANSTRLLQVSGKQWAAIGDAAISFDPLSSQGMFHAMASAMQLKHLIVDCNLIHSVTNEKQEHFQKTYTSQMEVIWQQYVHHKHIFYSSEMRWNDSLFWKRRQSNYA